MLFFLIVPVWLFFLLLGVLLFFFKMTKFLSLYLILIPTSGTILSLALSTLWLWLAPEVFFGPGSWTKWAFLALYLACIAFGGMVGGIAGFFAALKLNRRFRWTPSI